MSANVLTEITLLTKEGCLPCVRIKRIMKELKEELPGLDVKEIDYASQEGIALSFKNRVYYPPAVFIDGSLFGFGKILEEPLKEAVRNSPTRR